MVFIWNMYVYIYTKYLAASVYNIYRYGSKFNDTVICNFLTF